MDAQIVSIQDHPAYNLQDFHAGRPLLSGAELLDWSLEGKFKCCDGWGSFSSLCIHDGDPLHDDCPCVGCSECLLNVTRSRLIAPCDLWPLEAFQSCEPPCEGGQPSGSVLEIDIVDNPGEMVAAAKPVKREDYVIMPKFLKEVLRLFPTGKPWRDMFSTAKTAQFEDFVEDCDKADWDDDKVMMWVNPPFSLWERTAAKIVRASSAECICLIPDWGQQWLETLLSLSVKYYVPAGVGLFKLDDRAMPPTKWGCWLLHVPPRPRTQGPVYSPVTILPWNLKLSKGKKRRERSKRVKDVGL